MCGATELLLTAMKEEEAMAERCVGYRVFVCF